MNSIFNWNTFRGHLQEEISDFEYGFLRKVFSQAALSFGAFGTAVCVLSYISGRFALEKYWWVAASWIVIAVIASIACMFYYLPRYHSNPMSVGVKFVRRAYITLIISYGTVFLVFLKLLAIAAKALQSTTYDSEITITLMALALFAVTLIVYAVPASIGFFMQKHKTALKLSKFLRYCYFSYFVMFLVSLILAFASVGFKAESIQKMWKAESWMMLVLCGAITFVTPVLSVYRMKMVVKYLDQKDAVAVKKWELFFVFETLCQLMQMAVYIFRIAFNCLSCTLSVTSRR